MPIGPRGPVKVAVIDTGIDITNPFIAEKWKPGSTESPNEFYRDFVDDVETANTLKEDWEAHYNSSAIRIRLRSIAEREGDNPQDLHGHGTHMAGIILQLAPDAQLYVGRLMRRVSHDARDARRLALVCL
jgi:subtilisin family serine protease